MSNKVLDLGQTPDGKIVFIRRKKDITEVPEILDIDFSCFRSNIFTLGIEDKILGYCRKQGVNTSGFNIITHVELNALGKIFYEVNYK